MPQYTIALFLLLTPTHSLVVERHVSELSRHDAQDTVTLCNASFLWLARQLLASNDWEALKTNPCVGEDLCAEIASGIRDPADNHEFLGNPSVESLLSFREKAKLPRVLFLGLPHSGSTSLADQMNLHPELSYGLMKEHNLLYNIGATSYDKFREAYKSTFAYHEDSVKYTFDASPATLFIANEGDQDMLKHYAIGTKVGTGMAGVQAVRHILQGPVKLIVMLRDPLDWQISMTPTVHRTIDGFLDGEHQVLGKRACYANSIEKWMEIFGRDSFLFLESGEYFANPQETLDQVFSFLSVSAKEFSPEELTAQGRRRSTRVATDKERRIFWEDQRMQECKERLEMLTGRKWDWGPH